MEWSFATCWESVADLLPDRVALVQGERRVTWRQLDDRSARLAGALRARGLEPGAKVAVYLYNANEYLETTFAAFKARAVPVNVNYRYLEEELEYLLENADAEALVFHGSLGDRVDRVRSRLPGLRAVVQVDDGSPHLEGALRYEDLVAGHEPAPREERSGDDLLLLYTGGTTGMPKGVMWRQEDLYLAVGPSLFFLAGQEPPEGPAGVGAVAARLAEAGQAPVHLPASPLMHGTGFFTSLQALLAGGTVVTLEGRRFDPHELWATVQRERVTQAAIVGDAFAKPMLRALEEAEDRGRPYDLSTLVMLASSGVMWTAPVKEGLMARGGFICFDALGSSEGVGFGSNVSAPGATSGTARFQIGEHARVVTEDGRDVVPGTDEIGQLALGGPIPLGYYKDPDKTAATFRVIDGRRYSIPGDWARVEADGTVVLLGRGSVSINTGGEKVFPEEVEEALKGHPAVADVVVVGVPDDRFGEAVAAVLSLHDGASADEDALRAAVRGHLAGYKQPRHVVVVDEVPRAANGKADYGWARREATARLGLG
ncbi:MAG: acyl-CoA synthetase [Acidimicrobiia bacterium]|nr:acyl-CoA synthetase [Acidimicrobiia bacterium]